MLLLPLLLKYARKIYQSTTIKTGVAKGCSSMRTLTYSMQFYPLLIGRVLLSREWPVFSI